MCPWSGWHAYLCPWVVCRARLRPQKWYLEVCVIGVSFVGLAPICALGEFARRVVSLKTAGAPVCVLGGLGAPTCVPRDVAAPVCVLGASFAGLARSLVSLVRPWRIWRTNLCLEGICATRCVLGTIGAPICVSCVLGTAGAPICVVGELGAPIGVPGWNLRDELCPWSGWRAHVCSQRAWRTSLRPRRRWRVHVCPSGVVGEPGAPIGVLGGRSRTC